MRVGPSLEVCAGCGPAGVRISFSRFLSFVPSKEKHAGIGRGRNLFLSDSPPLWLTVVVQLLFRRARGESKDALDYYTWLSPYRRDVRL
jgi:hypothetical protein